MKVGHVLSAALYMGFLLCVGVVCLLRPVPDDFDRYIYEAIVRGRTQSLQAIYPIVKHSNPRAEASSVLDSPEHMGQLEPLYAIRPVYIWAIELLARTGLPIQKAINGVSAMSLVGIGLLLFGCTRAPLPCALIMASPAIVLLGRMGTPDALSALFILSSAWALSERKDLLGLLLLMTSVWVRTDNVLLVLILLAWLGFEGRLRFLHAGVLAALALCSVLFINHYSGNYGWSILFHYSFIGGRSPAEVPTHVTFRQYAVAFAKGAEQIGGQQMSLWILLGITAFYRGARPAKFRWMLVPFAVAAATRFVLFPTIEDRYFAWAYLVVGAAFLEGMFPNEASASQPASSTPSLEMIAPQTPHS